MVRPELVRDGTDGPTLVYPWCDGVVLNHATTGGGSDRSGLARFQRLPVAEVRAALATILDAHLAVSAAGYVAVDLYDGCFLYDFDAHRMRLIDLDEYRPGPFVLDSDRLPGSRRYLSPEELTRGATIDERTTVHALGRTLHHLLDARPAGVAPPPSARSPTGRPVRPVRSGGAVRHRGRVGSRLASRLIRRPRQAGFRRRVLAPCASLSVTSTRCR